MIRCICDNNFSCQAHTKVLKNMKNDLTLIIMGYPLLVDKNKQLKKKINEKKIKYPFFL